MKIVVKKNALENVINSLVSEERSYHSRNVNELEKADPPILPQPQMAQQLSTTQVPVNDPEFLPTNNAELGKAAMELAQNVDSRSIKNFYKGLKKLTKSYQDEPPQRTSNTHSLDEARKTIDNFVRKILVAEARGSSYEEPSVKDLTAQAMKDAAGASDAVVSAERERYKEYDEWIPLSSLAIGDAGKLLDAIIKVKGLVPSPTAAGELEDAFQDALDAMQFIETPTKITIKYPGLPFATAVHNIGTDPRNKFDKETYTRVLNSLGSQYWAGTQYEDSVGPMYAERFTPSTAEAESAATENTPRSPRSTGNSYLETGAYNLAVSDVTDMLEEKPDEFMALLKKVGPIDIEGTTYDPATMTLEQFDNLDDLKKIEFIKKIARLPKEVFEPIKRELQVMARGLGPIFDDEDEDSKVESDYTVTPEGAIMASPRAAFPGDLIQIVYDETITSPIRGALGFTSFDVTADQFLSNLGGDEGILKFRDFAKDIIKKAIVNNTAEFRDILNVFYHILKTEKLEILDKAKAKSGALTEIRKEDELYKRKSLAPYRAALEILEKIGMPLDKSMLDQNFRDMITFNHLCRAIIYAIVIKYVMSLDLNKDDRDRASMAKRILAAIEKQYNDSPLQFTLPASGRSPAGFGRMLGYKVPPTDTWEKFSKDNKEKIDKLIARVLKAQTPPTAAEIALNARNLTGPVEGLLEDFKTGIELSIGTMLGRERGKIFKSIDPKNLAYVIRALEMYRETVDGADQEEVDETIAQLKSVKPGASVDKLTASKKMSDFPEGEPLFEEKQLRNLIRMFM
jgi:hypothetical protein